MGGEGGNDYPPFFYILTSNSGPKLTGTLRKTPEFRKMALMISLSELILAFFDVKQRIEGYERGEKREETREKEHRKSFADMYMHTDIFMCMCICLCVCVFVFVIVFLSLRVVCCCGGRGGGKRGGRRTGETNRTIWLLISRQSFPQESGN